MLIENLRQELKHLQVCKIKDLDVYQSTSHVISLGSFYATTFWNFVS